MERTVSRPSAFFYAEGANNSLPRSAESGERPDHLKNDSPTTNDWPGRLCPSCALCCNGVLFADVRLQPVDQPAQLVRLGVTLKTRGTITRLPQPCSCLEGNLCRIYADRPTRCRTFECRLLQSAQAGETTEQLALKTIRAGRAAAEEVRRILHELGDTDESDPLSRRYQRQMREPVDLAGEERLIDLRGELMMAVSRLVGLLERDFLG